VGWRISDVSRRQRFNSRAAGSGCSVVHFSFRYRPAHSVGDGSKRGTIPMKTGAQSHKSEGRRDFELFRKRLLSELQTHQQRVDRARHELLVDSEPDDDAGMATRSAYREVTTGKLERDLLTIVEIERALRRLDRGQYAMCVGCQSRIPDARLKAIPWTRTCIECAGRSNRSAPSLRLTPGPADKNLGRALVY
jgi:DnaK suppressor protein